MKNQFMWFVVFISSLTLANTAQAELTINGFLSVSGGTLTNNDIPGYRGYDDDWNTDPDTTFALQFGYQLSDKVSATGQIIAKGVDDYDVDASWAYITYSATENVDIRVGKLRIPFFYYSDFLDVGYAYPWIAPPFKTYRIPFADFGGVDTLIRNELGDWGSTVQLSYGRHESELDGGQDITLKNLYAASWTMNRDWLTFRLGVTGTDLTLEAPAALTPLLVGLELAGFSSVANQLVPVDDSGVFYDAAVNIDYNDWLLMFEYTEIDRDKQTFVSQDYNYLVMVGKRWQDFTFHVTWNNISSDNDRSFIDVIPDGVDPGLDALKAGANATIVEADATDYIFGIRYDFAPSTAFKFEVTRIKDDILNMDDTLVAFAVDMVF